MAHEDVETGNVTNDGVMKTHKRDLSDAGDNESRPGSSASQFAARLARASAKKKSKTVEKTESQRLAV